MNDYTQHLEDQIFQISNEDEEITADKVLNFLNSGYAFRTFGNGLCEIMEKKFGDLIYKKSPEAFLLEKSKDKDVDLNRNTVKNWFSGMRPKKGDQSREHMFKVAFALELTIDETCDLFTKVYLDRPFYMRNVSEFIYYYCLKQGETYQKAQNLIDAVSDVCNTKEDTIFTHVIKSDADLISTSEDVLTYIRNHQHNFQLNNKSAKKVLNILLEQIIPTQDDKTLIAENKVNKDRLHGYLAKEIYINEGLVDKNKSITSISTMLDVIEGVDLRKEQQQSDVSVFKNACLPQEIMNRFPTKHSFSKDENSSEEIRKMIILLDSYKLWYECQYEDEELDLEIYQDELDALLYECGLQELYLGNPYDWLFLYCASCEYPLDQFRMIMQQVFCQLE